MKLQLTPQTVRLRLDEEDIQEFARASQLSHTLRLGGGQHLTYTLRQLPADAPDGLHVRYEADTIAVELPAALARQLIEGAAISLKSELAGTDDHLIRILVEKDLGPSH